MWSHFGHTLVILMTQGHCDSLLTDILNVFLSQSGERKWSVCVSLCQRARFSGSTFKRSCWACVSFLWLANCTDLHGGAVVFTWTWPITLSFFCLRLLSFPWLPCAFSWNSWSLLLRFFFNFPSLPGFNYTFYLYFTKCHKYIFACVAFV